MDVYAQSVAKIVQDEGKLIIDIRAGTNGIEQLEQHFDICGVIEQSDVRVRVVATPKRAY